MAVSQEIFVIKQEDLDGIDAGITGKAVDIEANIPPHGQQLLDMINDVLPDVKSKIKTVVIQTPEQTRKILSSLNIEEMRVFTQETVVNDTKVNSSEGHAVKAEASTAQTADTEKNELEQTDEGMTTRSHDFAEAPTGPLLSDDETVRIYQVSDTSTQRVYVCNTCQLKTHHKDSMKRHLQRLHKIEWTSAFGNKYNKCIHPDCESVFWHKKAMLHHMKAKHPDYNIEEKTFVTENFQSFMAWKEQEERERFVYFSKKTSSYKNKDGTLIHHYYHCQRSGSHVPHRRKNEDTAPVKRKLKGSCKINQLCPATIRVNEYTESSKCQVTYAPFHNHEISFKDTKHHPIPNRLRAEIKDKLLRGVPAKQIHKDLSDWSLSADGGNRKNRQISLRAILMMKSRLQKALDSPEQVKVEADLPTLDLSAIGWSGITEVSPTKRPAQGSLPSLEDTCNRAAAAIAHGPFVPPVCRVEEVVSEPKQLRTRLGDYSEDELAAAAIMPNIPFLQPNRVFQPPRRSNRGRPPKETSREPEIFESVASEEVIIEIPTLVVTPIVDTQHEGRTKQGDNQTVEYEEVVMTPIEETEHQDQEECRDVVVHVPPALPGPALHETIEPLSWLLGKWRSEEGQGQYPTIRNFTYGEEAHFFHIGQPILQLSINSWHSTTRKPLHLETGFIRICPGTNKVAFIVAQNTGVAEVSEGELSRESDVSQLTVESHTCGRLSFGEDPAVKKIKRRFLHDGNTLTQIVCMETSTVPMQEHLRITYQRVG